MPRPDLDRRATDSRWSVSIAIVLAVPPVDHDLGAVPVIPMPVLVPMPVSLAYLHPNAADPDIGPLRDDHRLVGNVFAHWLAALEGFEPVCVDFEPASGPRPF
jgi:hypothetical protein